MITVRHLGLAGLLCLMLGCSHPVSSPIQEVPDPDKLETMDSRVREQYFRLRRRVEAEDNPGHDKGESARAWAHLGQWFHAYRLLTGAELAYSNARALDPNEPQWAYYLGWILLNQGRLDGASEQFEAVGVLQPEYLGALIKLGEIRFEQGDLDGATAEFKRALVVDAHTVAAHHGLAKIAMRQSEPERAIVHLEQALEIYPAASGLRYALGMALREAGKRDRAEAELMSVAEGGGHQPDPGFHDPWMRELGRFLLGSSEYQARGVEALEAGHFEEAESFFKRVLAADDGNIEGRVNLGVALNAQSRVEEAIVVVRDALSRSPGHVRAHSALGAYLQRLGRFDEAEAEYKAVLKLEPANATVHCNLGALLRSTDRVEQARAHYAEARRLQPQLLPARFGHALCLMLLGDLGNARSVIEEDMLVFKRSRALGLLLARVLATDDIRQDFEAGLGVARAARGNHFTVFSEESLALAYAANRQWAAAVERQEAVLQAVRTKNVVGAVSWVEDRLILYRQRRCPPSPWRLEERKLDLAVHAEKPVK